MTAIEQLSEEKRMKNCPPSKASECEALRKATPALPVEGLLKPDDCATQANNPMLLPFVEGEAPSGFAGGGGDASPHNRPTPRSNHYFHLPEVT
jgi:hypothetical protein